MQVLKAIFFFFLWKDFTNVEGTKENLELSKEQFETLINNLLGIFRGGGIKVYLIIIVIFFHLFHKLHPLLL